MCGSPVRWSEPIFLDRLEICFQGWGGTRCGREWLYAVVRGCTRLLAAGGGVYLPLSSILVQKIKDPLVSLLQGHNGVDTSTDNVYIWHWKA